MEQVWERFLRYVKIDTQSLPDKEEVPSTEKQKNLGKLLKEELCAMGASNVRMDDHGYVYGEIPGNVEGCPAVGFIAHMDTSEAISGKDVKPRLIQGYAGEDIILNKEQNIVLKTEDFPEICSYQGQDLIVTDGTTLLGADDKAGVAEIMTMAQAFLEHPQWKHGKICIAFTPDEETGRGVDFFDVKGFGADAAYTVDGGALGELEYENFNAASVKLTVHGFSIHTGSAKGKLVNAAALAMEYESLMPALEKPEATEGYEGFIHLHEISGNMEKTVCKYMIRDHDREKFEQKKALMKAAAAYMNQKYGKEYVSVEIKDSYYNMKEMVEPHMELIDYAVKAMEKNGVAPVVTPIRGGTDGARLSFMGLPCPNLCTGGHNFHGRYEYVCVQSMEKVVSILTDLAKLFAEN